MSNSLYPGNEGFVPERLDRTIIAIPLLDKITEEGEGPFKVIIDLNLTFSGGRQKAAQKVKRLLKRSIQDKNADTNVSLINQIKSRDSQQYLFATLEGKVIFALVQADKSNSKSFSDRAIYRIWPDFEIKPFVFKSCSTIKADAAKVSFGAYGEDITWAVMDSGIDKEQDHFKLHCNLDVPQYFHKDFTVDNVKQQNPFSDELGHGTHIAGVIAGEQASKEIINNEVQDKKLKAAVRERDSLGQSGSKTIPIEKISGISPRTKLVSLKVINGFYESNLSNLLAAINHIQEINGFGRHLLIHGVNISVGYPFDPEWFACGQSPLCVEIDRLVNSGVVVVVAAGNSGYNSNDSHETYYSNLSICDPGNAELAITVGSTHRDMPHVYGISYFSSKGPTGDGRLKPDLIAPGEKIISCISKKAIKQEYQQAMELGCEYIEESGTSMAAPHVSGVIAAFLSVRKEFIGRPKKVKDVFLSTATDLKRDPYFQGHGLVDLMRAIQSV